MTIIRANDENNDWIYGLGANAYKVNNDAIAQDIQTKIQEWVGDCFFNLPAGIDWINRFADGNSARLEQEINSLILKVNNVVNVNNLSVDVTNRLFTASYDVQTVYSASVIGEIKLYQ